jgi:hypothetical protein
MSEFSSSGACEATFGRARLVQSVPLRLLDRGTIAGKIEEDGEPNTIRAELFNGVTVRQKLANASDST